MSEGVRIARWSQAEMSTSVSAKSGWWASPGARGVAHEQLAARRQVQPLLAAIEQLGADGSLELADARGDARLHAVQLARRLHDAAFLDHGLEDAKVGQVHGAVHDVLDSRTSRSLLFNIEERMSRLGCWPWTSPPTAPPPAARRSPAWSGWRPRWASGASPSRRSCR